MNVTDEMMIQVKSSNIKAIGFNGKELRVDFVGSGTYLYREVQPETMDKFIKSESKGIFFAQNIKGKYAFEKITTQNPIIDTETKTKEVKSV